VRLEWFTAGTPNPDPERALGRAYLLRGQGVVFSRGFGQLCGALRRAGWWAEDLRCVGGLWLWRHLRREQQSGRLQCPLVFVGHSCGGRSALDTARQLQELGIAVRLIVCVDVAFPYSVHESFAGCPWHDRTNTGGFSDLKACQPIVGRTPRLRFGEI
jgi:pimeloyl-ACP methyl ester carboxylesterase